MANPYLEAPPSRNENGAQIYGDRGSLAAIATASTEDGKRFRALPAESLAGRSRRVP